MNRKYRNVINHELTTMHHKDSGYIYSSHCAYFIKSVVAS